MGTVRIGGDRVSSAGDDSTVFAAEISRPRRFPRREDHNRYGTSKSSPGHVMRRAVRHSAAKPGVQAWDLSVVSHLVDYQRIRTIVDRHRRYGVRGVTGSVRFTKRELDMRASAAVRMGIRPGQIQEKMTLFGTTTSPPRLKVPAATPLSRDQRWRTDR